MQQGLRRARNKWRRELRGRWHDIRPAFLLGLAVTSLVLGTIGFLQLRSATPRYGFLDAVYRSITLFAFGGAATPPIPPTLQIARILAPVLTGYAAIGTLLALTRDQARVLAIRLFLRRHVIVAGLGATGSRLALSLIDHEPVVVLESNPTNERHAAARLRGVRVLIGEATDEVLLRRAGIQQARSLVVACGSDATNVDVAAAAIRAVGERRQPLTVFAHLRDLDLWTSLAAEASPFGAGRAGVRLEYFNVLATGAQLLLEAHPPFEFGAANVAPRRPHILIVGLESVGEQLVLQIARLWSGSGLGDRDELRITLAGPNAERDLAELRTRYPALDRYCTLGSRQLELESARFQEGAPMLDADGKCDVTGAYVALADEGDALLASLGLHARPDTTKVPVVVAVADADAGIALLVAADQGRFIRISSFGVLSAATSDELLLRGTNELLARAQHAQWLRNEHAKGTLLQDNPNLKPWEELDDVQREDNRRFADDLHTKLQLIGCMLVPMPLPDPDEPRFVFDPSDLELLSHHEHARWLQTKLDAGWHYGASRDDTARIHDQLKPWEELDEPNREKDRNAVREIPDMLALAGFRIQKANGVAKGT